MSLVKLWSHQGADECNIGTKGYRVDNDGSVWVPEEGIGPLLEKGGFVLADPPARQPVVSGFAHMMHPDPTATCSIRGVVYTADERGALTVPAAVAHELLAHGFDYCPRGRFPPVG
jgi:hypothetical protein